MNFASIRAQLARLWSRGTDASAPGTPAHLATGQWGEGVAERHLLGNGFKILGRRVRFNAREELDLVARDGEVLVFVEVKTRNDETFGRPAAAVGRHKQRLLGRAALQYLRRLGFPPAYIRFDVVEVIGRSEGTTPPVVRHIRNAFQLDRRYQLPAIPSNSHH
mgnify:CR=1 FL=1